jgi:hypothetical protein
MNSILPPGGDGVARGGSKNYSNPLTPQGGTLTKGEYRVIIRLQQVNHYN